MRWKISTLKTVKRRWKQAQKNKHVPRLEETLLKCWYYTEKSTDSIQSLLGAHGTDGETDKRILKFTWTHK